jgi:anti-sigma-K factor RskA
MADDPDTTSEYDPELAGIEAMLRELTVDDLEPVTPPPSVWAGIEARIGDDAPSAVVSLAERRVRRGRRGWVLAAAAAVVAVVAGAIVVVATRGGTEGAVVASARLTWDPAAFDPLGRDASATADLVEHDGEYDIVLRDASLPTALGEPADLELWLIEVRDDGTLDVQPVSLVDGAEPGTYRVPAGLDPFTHPVVDISVEPRDGDHDHSGRSILRGPLATA